MNINIHIHININIHMYTHKNTHTHTHSYTYTYINTHSHTHTFLFFALGSKMSSAAPVLNGKKIPTKKWTISLSQTTFKTAPGRNVNQNPFVHKSQSPQTMQSLNFHYYPLQNSVNPLNLHNNQRKFTKPNLSNIIKIYSSKLLSNRDITTSQHKMVAH